MKDYPNSQVQHSTNELDYQAMWDKLGMEILHYHTEGVTNIHPVILLSYMHFLEQEATANARGGTGDANL